MKATFRILPDCGMSLLEQVRSQIISSLYTGRLREGDSLPSVRELAQEAGLNPKSIHRLYHDLQEEELVRVVHGKGVFVRSHTGGTFSRLRRDAVLGLVRATTEKANLLGLGPERFARILLRYSTGEDLKPLPCVLVDDEEELATFSAELERRMSVQILPIPLQDAPAKLSRENRELSGYRHVLTTSWHLGEVRALAEPLGMEVLEIRPDPGVYAQILAEARERNVGVVVGDPRTLHAPYDAFLNIFHPSTNRRFLVAAVHDEERMAELAREADVAYTSPFCVEEAKKILPAGLELREIRDVISNEFLEELQLLQLVL